MPTIQMNDSCPDEHLSRAASIVLSLWFSLSGFATVAGNAVVLWLFYRNESLRTTSNGFLTSLSVTDFLVGLVIDPVWIVIRCLIQPPVQSTLHYCIYMLWIHTTTATTFNLCCVSVDRFIAIRFPFRYQDFVTKKRCCTVIILVWLISLCLPFTAISVDLLGNIASAVLWLSLAFVTFVAPLFVVTFCYMFMFKASRRQCRRMFPNENRQSFDTKNIPGNGTMKNFKAIKTVGYILGFYIVSWMPSLVLLVVHSYYTATNHLCYDIKIDKVVWPWVEAIAFTSSAINPLIYYLRNNEFRRAFHRTFRWLPFVHGQNSPNINLSAKPERSQRVWKVGTLVSFASKETKFWGKFKQKLIALLPNHKISPFIKTQCSKHKFHSSTSPYIILFYNCLFTLRYN